MAGELLLTFAAEGILTRVSSLVAQELSLAWGFKSELKKLGQSLLIIQDFLRGAADRIPGEHGKAVEDWVKKLKDIAHDADDVLDEFNYEILRRKVQLQNHMKRKVINFLSATNPLLFRLKMAHKIKKINYSLVELKNEAAFINLVAKKRDSRRGGERSDREQTDSFLEKDEKVVGREVVVTEIVETLINFNNQQNLSVMAIVGMPGLGKTTLAKSVYHNSDVGTHFNKKIWVCVSNTFEVVTILNQMVDSLIPGKGGMQSQDALLKVLEEELSSKRYVLVLDDVWNEDSIKWESLMSCLSKLSSNKGSSIIITTRSTSVALTAERSIIAKTLPRPVLKFLSDDECWSILKQRLQNIDENGFIDADREKIGRAIAEKCGGIPLVAKVLGGIMRSKVSKDEWLSIQESAIWTLPEKEDRIMPVLKISFDNLNSPSLKQCFAYCSMLKKDFEIERDDLIQLWMAQGLLQPSTDDKMEDKGNQYFNELLENSLLQEVTEGDTNTKFTMHDLVHDLAEEVSKCDSLTRDQNVSCEIRHAAHLPISRLSCMLETVGRLRSLFSNDHVPREIFSKFKALRVFSLRGAEIDELPDSFGKLKHLRYLDVSNTKIKALPKSIGKLYNLQTLRLQNPCLKEIPREIQNLTNLRHLYFNKDVKVPAGIFRGLTNLRTLPYFNVGKEIGHGIEELGYLEELQGKLAIRNMENVRDEEEVSKAKLDSKILLGLSFVWTENRNRADGLESNTNDSVKDESVLERLQPHTELESLKIKNFLGSKFPSWMMRSPLPLYNLKNLILSGCLNCEEVPVLGHLPKLEHVKIYEMDNLKRLGSEFYGHNHVHEAARGKTTTTSLFPELKTLSIQFCGELTEWMEEPTSMTSEVTIFPCLEKLSLRGCPLLINAPSRFPSLKELRIGVMDSKRPLESICSEVSTLTFLRIENIKGLTSLSSGMLKNNKDLRYMGIRGCDELTHISVSGCSNLRELNISNCQKLEHLPESLDTASLLKELTIRECPTLKVIPIAVGLTSFRKLLIGNCEGLSSIGVPDGYTFLQVLEIDSCGSLTSFPISRGLASLCELRIKGCDGLLSIGQLERCTSLQVLEIYECGSLTSIPISQGLASLCKLRIMSCEGLLSIGQLDHCTSLKVLEIESCGSLTSVPISQRLASLCKLRIIRCDGLLSIGQLDHCTSLKVLEIESCGSLTSIPISQGLASLCKLRIMSCGLSSLPSGIENCTSLQELEIDGCSNLVAISFTRVLPSLRRLEVEYCTKLSCLPDLDYCPSLQALRVGICPNLASLSISTELNPCRHCLQELSISSCGGLQSLPDFHSFTSLCKLSISNCAGLENLVSGFHIPVSVEWLRISLFNNLESLPDLEECTSLRQLNIQNCGKLKSLPPGLRCLDRLERLELGPFWRELDTFPDFQVSSQQLVSLELNGWPKLKSLPQPIIHFTSVTEMTIKNFNGVEALPEWLGNLTSVRQLTVMECENVKYLPSLKAMRGLTKLDTLGIANCPLLVERCTKDSGEEWPKISHVPDIRII